MLIPLIPATYPDVSRPAPSRMKAAISLSERSPAPHGVQGEATLVFDILPIH
jgi:hypothetical protein